MTRFLNYMHLNVGGGHVTCAIDHPAIAKDDTDVYPEELVHVGVSFCSPRDVFVKKTGRQKAFGRLKTGGNMTFVFSPVPDKPFKQQVKEVLEYLMDENRKVAEQVQCPVDNCWSFVGIPRWANGKVFA